MMRKMSHRLSQMTMRDGSGDSPRRDRNEDLKGFQLLKVGTMKIARKPVSNNFVEIEKEEEGEEEEEKVQWDQQSR